MEKRMMERNLVFVLGMGRSETSALTESYRRPV
jgi:hypothetical protein